MADDQRVGEDREPERLDIEVGTAVYDRSGRKLGTVQGYGHHTFEVSIEEGHRALGEEHVRSEATVGEAELMWRCINCGEMGDIEDGIPGECPNCGHPREELMYWTED